MSNELGDSDQYGYHNANLDQWVKALGYLTLALTVLDASHAPPEIGATIDVARHSLQEAIDEESAD